MSGARRPTRRSSTSRTSSRTIPKRRTHARCVPAAGRGVRRDQLSRRRARRVRDARAEVPERSRSADDLRAAAGRQLESRSRPDALTCGSGSSAGRSTRPMSGTCSPPPTRSSPGAGPARFRARGGQPLKADAPRHRPQATGWRWCALTSTATPGSRSTPIEIDRDGLSFTVDTLGEFARRHPASGAFLPGRSGRARDLRAVAGPADGSRAGDAGRVDARADDDDRGRRAGAGAIVRPTARDWRRRSPAIRDRSNEAHRRVVDGDPRAGSRRDARFVDS